MAKIPIISNPPEAKIVDKATAMEIVKRILKEYNYKESEIPLNHEYWKIKNRI